jgi:hypothetical protein
MALPKRPFATQSPDAKMPMMLESVVSMVTLVIVASRATNILN